MKIVSVVFFFMLIAFSCTKKKKEIKDMHIQEPDFSEMIRKSDSIRKNAILQRAQEKSFKEVIKKETPKENIKENIKEKTSKEFSKKEVLKEVTPKVTHKENPTIKEIKKPSRKVINKIPKPIIINKFKNSSGLIYTVQIAALDYEDKKYNAINNVIKYKENSLVKYGLGSFKTFKDAQEFRSKIIHKYKGAFVKALRNNIPVSIK